MKSPIQGAECSFLKAIDLGVVKQLMRQMVDSVRLGGHLLIANCFEHVVMCCLPSTFYLRYSFENLRRVFGSKNIAGFDLPYGSMNVKASGVKVSSRDLVVLSFVPECCIDLNI